MSAQRLLIIGAGYVGRAVGTDLVRRGWRVCATTTTTDKLNDLEGLGFRAVQLDVIDTDALPRLIRDQDAVLLCLAPKSRDEDYRQVYLAAARSLASALPNSTITRVIYTSSTRVYGQNDGAWMDESSPTVPNDDAGRVLLEAEDVLLNGVQRLHDAEKREVSATVLRLSGIYGPGRDPAERVRALAGQPRAGGNDWINLIHRDDIVTAIGKLLPVRHNGVLNLSDDAPTTRREYYDRILTEAKLPPILWQQSEGKTIRGKRIRNLQIKSLLGMVLKRPTH